MHVLHPFLQPWIDDFYVGPDNKEHRGDENHDCDTWREHPPWRPVHHLRSVGVVWDRAAAHDIRVTKTKEANARFGDDCSSQCKGDRGHRQRHDIRCNFAKHDVGVAGIGGSGGGDELALTR